MKEEEDRLWVTFIKCHSIINNQTESEQCDICEEFPDSWSHYKNHKKEFNEWLDNLYDTIRKYYHDV